MKRKLERKSSVRCFLESLNKEPTFKGERSNSFPSNDSKKFDIKAPIDGTTGHLLSLERCSKGYSLFQGLKYRQGHNFTKLTKSDKKIKLPKKNIMKSSIAKFTCQRNFAANPIVIDGNEKKIAGNTSENLFSILSEKVQEQKSQKETIVKKLYFKDISANLTDAYHVLSVESEKPTQIDQEIAQNDNQNQRNGFLYRNKKGERKSSEIQKQKSPKHLFEPINSHFKIGNPLDIILPPPVEFSDRKLEPSVSSNIFSPTALAIADYQEANIPELNANKRLEISGSIKNKQQFKVYDNSYSLALTRAYFKQNTANSAPVTFAAEKLKPSVTNDIFTPPVLAVADCQVANIPEIDSNKQFEDGEPINKKERFKVVDNNCSLALTRACFKQNTANSAPVTFAAEKLKPSVTNDIFTPPVLAVADCQVANIPEIDSNKQFEDGEPINKKERFKVVDNNCSLALTRACFKQNTANSAAVTFADEKLKHSVTNDIFTPPVLAVADCQVANIPEIDSNKQFEDGEPINKKERFKVVDNNCSLALTRACFKQNTANSAPVTFAAEKLKPSVTNDIFTPPVLAVADCQVANIPEIDSNKQFEDGEPINKKERFKVVDNNCSLALTRACFKQNTANSAAVTFADEKLKHSVTNAIFTPPVLAVADCQVANIPEFESNKQFEDGESINKKEKFKVVDNNCSVALTHASIRLNTAINDSDYKIQKNNVALGFQNEECSSSLMFNCQDVFSCNELAMQKENVTLGIGSNSALDISDIQNPIQQQEVKNGDDYIALEEIHSLDQGAEKTSDSMDVQKTSHNLGDIKGCSDLTDNALTLDCNRKTVTITGGDFIHSCTGKESTDTLVLPELSCSINPFPLMYKGFAINPVSGHTLTVGTGINSLPILFKSNENDSNILPKGKSPFLKKMQDEPMSPLAMSDQMKLGNLVHEFALTLCNNDKDQSFFAAPFQSCNDADSALAEEIKFQKDSLKNSRVIAQLDSKFVCAFDDESGVIFVVDQHAAHERIKLEELFKEHIQPNGTVMHCPLNQPLILPFCEEKKKSAGTKVDLLQKCGVTLKDIAIGLEVTSVPLCFLLRKKHQVFYIN
ncbi:hypothetical protein QYM36_009317 [Artemia franciscana]|uniref:MutL C-terminal dimerisation domain-containing protein n=1 Tax=Artemia franciscana TaxID=6661 RepID=A0AA88HSW0_ARTSF|nr:hypothetical protein QYM36_009317 [Artemia franciscana]